MAQPKYSPQQGYGYVDPKSGYKFTQQGWTLPAQDKPDQQASPQATQPSGDLWGQYQPKFQAVAQQQDQLLKDYLAVATQLPTFQQQLLDSIKQSGQYPSNAAMREEYSQNPNLTPMAVEGLVSKRGQSTRGTIQDIMGRALGGFESDVASRKGAYEQSQQQRSNLLEEYGLAKGAQESGRGSVTERRSAEIKNAAIADAKGGLNSENFARKYGGQLDDWELINLYNQNSPHGSMSESPKTFKEWTKGVNEERNTEVAEKTAEYLQQVDTYASREEAMRDFELYKSVMEAQGVDTQSVLNAINQKFPPKTEGGENWIQGILSRGGTTDSNLYRGRT